MLKKVSINKYELIISYCVLFYTLKNKEEQQLDLSLEESDQENIRLHKINSKMI